MSEDIAERIKRIEDLGALEKLINTYHWRADHFKWQEWSECFTESAEFNLPNSFGLLRGRKEIHDVCKGNMDHVYGDMQHIMVNLDFELTGAGTATGHGNLIFTGIPAPEKPHENYIAGGRYNWEFTRTSDGWRISRARLDFIWNTGQDVGDVFTTS